MTANVLLGTAARTDHPPPLTACTRRASSRQSIIDPKTSAVVLTPVEVARYTQEAVEISSGLKAGDVVVRAGVHKLTAGQKVRVLAVPDAS
jgi:multidrug efflux pump subunit AcrA (membrane-fusion protein)